MLGSQWDKCGMREWQSVSSTALQGCYLCSNVVKDGRPAGGCLQCTPSNPSDTLTPREQVTSFLRQDPVRKALRNISS